VQLRQLTALISDQYVTEQAWRKATWRVARCIRKGFCEAHDLLARRAARQPCLRARGARQFAAAFFLYMSLMRGSSIDLSTDPAFGDDMI
jgi:hypothetical protein